MLCCPSKSQTLTLAGRCVLMEVSNYVRAVAASECRIHSPMRECNVCMLRSVLTRGCVIDGDLEETNWRCVLLGHNAVIASLAERCVLMEVFFCFV